MKREKGAGSGWLFEPPKKAETPKVADEEQKPKWEKSLETFKANAGDLSNSKRHLEYLMNSVFEKNHETIKGLVEKNQDKAREFFNGDLHRILFFLKVDSTWLKQFEEASHSGEFRDSIQYRRITKLISSKKSSDLIKAYQNYKEWSEKK